MTNSLGQARQIPRLVPTTLEPLACAHLCRQVLNQIGNRTDDEKALSAAAHGED